MSSRSSTTTTDKRGFNKQEVANFMKLGKGLAANYDKKFNVEDFKPRERTQERTETTSRSAFSGGSRSAGSTQVTGMATHLFSDVSKEQLELLTNLFMARQKDINARRARPGRRQTVLTR